MARGKIDSNWISNNYLSSTNPITSFRGSLYDNTIYPAVDTYADNAGIDDLTGREMLEVIQKGVYKTLVVRRDDAKALWEEEDDDASYGEYKALKDAVELLDAFLKQAPNARYSGLKRRDDYNRYDGYGRLY
jgi:hypothetical protein